jgi:membrane-anchored protein YejM (alkaline phosphatase superfamily)
MPRLTAWGRKEAVVFGSHEAGTYSSEAGLFSLLYGRSNLVFHETLDAHVPPLGFSWLRSVGYKVGYFTGHPIKWLRREEFLSASAVDIFVHHDDGSWPDWDRRALGELRSHVKESREPLFALAFLMATHFEYQYPKEYERHTPVASSKFQVSDVNALGAADRIPHLNRYKNSLAFLDDLIVDTIEELPDDALIVVTGDHGESFYEGKLYGHGYAFTDPVLQIPLLIRFPQGSAAPFVPQVVQSSTQHRDVMGLVARYLQGESLFLDGFHGHQTWWEPRESAVLSTYSSTNAHRVYCMLRVPEKNGSSLRLRLTLSSLEPKVSLLGFEDRYGEPVPTPALRPEMRARVEAAFRDELLRLTR